MLILLRNPKSIFHQKQCTAGKWYDNCSVKKFVKRRLTPGSRMSIFPMHFINELHMLWIVYFMVTNWQCHSQWLWKQSQEKWHSVIDYESISAITVCLSVWIHIYAAMFYSVLFLFFKLFLILWEYFFIAILFFIIF